MVTILVDDYDRGINYFTDSLGFLCSKTSIGK